MRPLVLLLSVWVLLLSGWSAAAQPSSDQGKWSGFPHRLPRQWTMSVNGNYHTTIRTLYQIVDPYFRLDARVEKAFGKAWMLFLDGRDLLDRPIGNGIISDIEKQNWYEETRSNRRLVQVGVTYQF